MHRLVWHLPGSEDFCETYTTVSRNDASENFPFLTWGNESVDAILNAISCKIPKDGPIQRISVQHNGVERISYLVASVGGPMLIKSVSDLDGLQITPNGFLSAPDIPINQTIACCYPAPLRTGLAAGFRFVWRRLGPIKARNPLESELLWHKKEPQP